MPTRLTRSDQKPAKRIPPEQEEERREIIAEYIADLRRIIENLRLRCH
jgi:hypothetical protein